MTSYKVEEILGERIIGTHEVAASSPAGAATRATGHPMQPRIPGALFVRVTRSEDGTVAEFSFAGFPC
ncbi:hypothetical protein [Mesorhizobium sp. B2-6-1]|uniref:hypothetical protein n=1 Tax=Mesorhizobium sp. B2-6-1 TaxID=2589916 RepID=UPI00112BC397|nr:hypothetical protein [Mesorhizobium sp. B2-6-1]TPJ61728.1 hypothetical protein FJ443_16205 [Mesorhizobium sp. B2-6-1]